MLSALLVAALVGPQIFIAAKDILAPVPFAGAYAATGVIAVLGLLPLAAVRPAVQPSATQMRGTRWGMARLA
ncbi:MAG: hypothetical protein OXD48_10875, partial [Litoreibacter sp.]|nr:hypothetical protein [Litoreibacter sp.]